MVFEPDSSALGQVVVHLPRSIEPEPGMLCCTAAGAKSRHKAGGGSGDVGNSGCGACNKRGESGC